MAADTKETLLDEAEKLFAAHGLEGATVRMIAAAAGANVAAINFHFGSFEALKRAVLMRRFIPLVEERMARLAALKAGARKPSARQILDAWLDPMLALSTAKEAGPRAFARILARTLIEPSPLYASLLGRELAAHTQAFLEAWLAALPELSAEEAANRLDFIIGAVGHALADSSRRESYLGKAQARDLGRLIPQLLAFVEAGIAAPPALAAPKRRRARSSK